MRLLLASDLHYFWTQETNTYEAEVRLTLGVRDRAGRQRWKGTINGTAERFDLLALGTELTLFAVLAVTLFAGFSRAR